MKEWKKWKKAAAILIIGSQIACPMLGHGTMAKVSAEENDVESSIDMEIPLNQEEGITLLHETSLDLSGISFQISDIRDSSKVSTFNGADGKQAVILFGGVATCGKTMTSLEALAGIVPAVDMSQLNIYVFDTKGSSTEDILSELDNVPEQIVVSSIDKDEGYKNLCATCFKGSTGKWMPHIFYKGADGVVYEYTSGRTSLEAIAENVRKGGLEVNINTNARKQVLKVTGQARYDESYKVLERLNQERAKAGVDALVMDEGLLETAMLRAAECTLYWSDDRPDGTSYHNASSKISEEVYVHGSYSNVEETVNSLRDSEWDWKHAILSEHYRSVGIGCFDTYGTCRMILCFWGETGTEGEKKSGQEATYAINAATNNVKTRLEETRGTLNVGEVRQLQIGVDNSWGITYIDADSYDWESNSPAATVSSDGVIMALSAGNAVIIGKNKANPLATLTYTLTVPEPKPDIRFGDSNGDGIVDSKDAVMIKRYMAGYTDQKIDLAASDVNADGIVDSKDAVKILKKLAGYDVVLGTK